MDKILVVVWLPESGSVKLNHDKWTCHPVPHVDVMAVRTFTLLLLFKYMKAWHSGIEIMSGKKTV